MYYDEHNPPHLHAEYQARRAVFDFSGNLIRGSLGSRTATRLVREWIDVRLADIEQDWELAREGKEMNKIEPLD